MNISKAIKRIKRDIGLYGIALPIENLDELILEILQDTTLPVFSIYCPMEEIVPLDIHQFIKGNKDRGENCDLFILPDNLFIGRELLYVKDIQYNESYLKNSYIPTSFSVQTPDLIENLMLTNAMKPIADTTVKRITFHYQHPRKVYIYDTLVSSQLILKVAFQHDSSFQSITPTSAESFFKLAELDVKDGLYQTVKHYDGIETAYGRIELKIDDWANAKQEREELIKEWDDSFLLDAVDMIYG